jgi:hypothetical protein
MRKPARLLLAALMLFLTACGPSPTVTPGTAAPTAAESSSPPSAAASVPAAAGSGVVLPNGPLPQEAYAPPAEPPRLYPEITHALIPRDDYGRLWPYVGGYAVQMWMTGEMYGLCDEAGRIVCDPVFNRVEILEKDGTRLYKMTENLADADGKDVSKITLAALDGSWAKEYSDVLNLCQEQEFMGERAFVWRERLTYDYITVCDNGKWGAIDYEGRELLPCVYSEPVCFSEGLAAVTSDDGGSVSFIDTAGRVVLGPYAAPPQQRDEWDYTGRLLPRNHGILFCEGLARFYNNGKYGVIDKTGRVVVPAEYDFITSFSKGTAETVIMEEDTAWRGVLGADGHVVYAPGDVWFQHAADGTVLLDTPQGQMALDPVTGAQTPWVNTGKSAGASYSQSSDGVVIYWDDGPQSFPDAVNVTFLDNGNLALSRRDGTWDIVDRSGAKVAGPFDGRADNYRDGLIYVYAGMSAVRDGTDTSYHTLYDLDGNRILPDFYRMILPIDGRYLVRQDTCAGLLDEQGNWVLKTPIYDYLTD